MAVDVAATGVVVAAEIAEAVADAAEIVVTAADEIVDKLLNQNPEVHLDFGIFYSETFYPIWGFNLHRATFFMYTKE
jgi:hypothetical protein